MSGDRPPCFCKTRLERPMRRSNGPITDTARLNVPPDASHGRHQTPASGAHRFQKCSFRRNHVRERSLCRPQQDQARKVADCSLRDPGIPPLEKRCPPLSGPGVFGPAPDCPSFSGPTSCFVQRRRLSGKAFFRCPLRPEAEKTTAKNIRRKIPFQILFWGGAFKRRRAA